MYYNEINISNRDMRIIKALEQKTIKNGASKFEEQSAKEKINSIMSKYEKEINNKSDDILKYNFNIKETKVMYCCSCHTNTIHLKISNNWICEDCYNETHIELFDKCPVCGESHHNISKILFINYTFYVVTRCKKCNALFEISYECEDDCKELHYTEITLPIYKIFIDLYDLYMKDKLHFKLAYLNSKFIDKLKFKIYYIFRKMVSILPR